MTQPAAPAIRDPLLTQLRKFLVETNAMALALGVVIGGAVSKLISTLVSGLIMPIVTLAIPGGEWRAWAIPLGSQKIAIGEVLGATVDFVVIAFVVFFMASKLFRIEVKK
jgi:large conductance mechanosensitive channel